MEKNVLPDRATGLDEVRLLSGMGGQVTYRASSRRRMDHFKRPPTTVPRIPSGNCGRASGTIPDCAARRSPTDEGAGAPDAGGAGEGYRIPPERSEEKG